MDPNTLTPDDFETRGVEVTSVLRERYPVVWIDALDGWFVTARDAIDTVLRDEDQFGTDSPAFKPREVFGPTMLNLDDEEHTRHRCPFDPGFRLRTVRDRYMDYVTVTADQLLADMPDQSPCDLGAAFASRLAVSVVTHALGLALPVDEVRGVYNTLAAAIGDYRNDPATMVAARDARAVFADALAPELERASQTGDGLLGDVLGEGSDLTEEEILANSLVVMFGGIETVESTIVNTAWCLLSHPRELDYTRQEGAWQAAVDEALRYAPPIAFLGRIARSDTRLGDASIKQGDQVFASVLAANRDPGFVDDPDAYLVHRGRAGQYLSFSTGVHFCLGYNLARLEGAVAVEKLFEAFPDLRPAGDLPPLNWFTLIRPAGGLQIEVGARAR